MRRIGILLLLALSFVAANEDFARGTSVILPEDEEEWSAFRLKHPRSLVMFYAPWCGHCKDLKPKFEAAARTAEFSLPFAAVDCTSEGGQGICSQFEVQGYPTLKFFSDEADDEGEPYEGGRTQDALEKFAKDKGTPFVVDANTDLSKLKIKALKHVLRERGVDCVGCREKAEFVKRVKETMHVTKPVLSEEDKAAEKEARKKAFLEKYGGRTLAEERRYQTAKKDAEAGWEDGNGNVVHLVDGELEAFRAEHPRMMIMFYTSWCGHCKNFKPEYAKASETVAEHLVLAAVNCELNPNTCRDFRVESYPTVKYFDEPAGHGRDFDGARTAKGVQKWVWNELGLESPPPPPFVNEPLWDENGKIHHLTDDHFGEFSKSTPRFLAMFYAPWCGHCKAMKPAFAAASEKVALPFVAVDCTVHAETCSTHGVNGYPTLKYFVDGETEDYNGGRSEEDLVAFASEKAEGGQPHDEL